MLIGGCKFSVRLYALATSALPLRAYVHAEGFALFASHAYNESTAAADPLAFLTNAHVRALHTRHAQTRRCHPHAVSPC